MEHTFSFPIKVFIAHGEHSEPKLVDDEIFIDLGDGAGTQHLAGTCYGIAVQECLRIGKDCYVLKVRPDMGGLLYSQLKENYKTFRLYRSEGAPESRILLTNTIYIRFAPTSTLEERCRCLGRYFPDVAEAEDLEDGVYALQGKFSEDPIAFRDALQFEVDILRVGLVVEVIPYSLKEAESADLLATR